MGDNMKLKMVGLSLAVCALSICGCKSSDKKESQESFSIDLSEKSPFDMLSLNRINIEVGETYDLRQLLKNSNLTLTDFSFTFSNANVTLDTEYAYTLKGMKKGVTDLYLFNNNLYQKIAIHVLEKGELSAYYSFDYARLSNKNVTIFGDSVTVGAGIGTNKRYWEILNKELNFANVDSFAVGGTTMTYQYTGSNISKEYDMGFGKNFNGVAFITNTRTDYKQTDSAQIKEEREMNKKRQESIKNADYVIIFYGHNDLYFQPPIGKTEELPSKIEDCKTFKASYAYALTHIKKVNPDARILLLAPSYSKYKPGDGYDIGVTYEDYRKAIGDMAEYYHVRFLDLWEPTLAAHNQKNTLQDVVHPNEWGHQAIADAIKHME